MTRRFDRAYFARQYRRRPWRAAGEKPILDASRIRLLRRWLDREAVLLDVGSGTGSFARRAARYFRVIAVDMDLGVVRAAAASSKASAIVGSAQQLPIASGCVDVVTSIDVVEHLSYPDQFFLEAYRVLCPGGYLHISTPNIASFGARQRGPASFMHQDETHCSLLPMDDWRAKLTRAGFEEVWSGTDGLWDVPYFANIPKPLQWLTFVGATQLAWMISPAFPWRHGENFLWVGRRR